MPSDESRHFCAVWVLLSILPVFLFVLHLFLSEQVRWFNKGFYIACRFEHNVEFISLWVLQSLGAFLCQMNHFDGFGQFGFLLSQSIQLMGTWVANAKTVKP